MPAPLELENGRLSQAQIDRYWDEGYLFPVPVITPAEAATARAELEQIERDWLDAGLPKPLNSYKRVNSNAVMPLSCRLAADPRILDVVEGIIGPDILIYGAEYFIKEPNTRHMVSMHQDLTYWGLGATSGMVTVWLALSSATPASGCMDFVRGSHKNPILQHADTFNELNLLSRGQEIQVDIAEADKTPIEIHPGQISLHHGLTIHGSGPNTTDDRRIAFVVRYVSPDVAQEVGEKDYAMLVRGADRKGNFINYAPPRGLFSPDGVAMWEEIRRAQSSVMMRGTDGKGKLYA
jgi:phytanoyl-CoA hydroxylase